MTSGQATQKCIQTMWLMLQFTGSASAISDVLYLAHFSDGCDLLRFIL